MSLFTHLKKATFESSFVCPYTLTDSLLRDPHILTRPMLLEHNYGGKFREIQHSKNHVMWALIHPWYEVGVRYTDRPMISASEADQVYLLKHYHQRSELVVSVGRLDKREWFCYTCGDKVPLAVLFRAAFRGMK